jgi:hypothetical protein
MITTQNIGKTTEFISILWRLWYFGYLLFLGPSQLPTLSPPLLEDFKCPSFWKPLEGFKEPQTYLWCFPTSWGISNENIMTLVNI